jgi:hypothetical protein
MHYIGVFPSSAHHVPVLVDTDTGTIVTPAGVQLPVTTGNNPYQIICIHFPILFVGAYERTTPCRQ